MKPFTENIGRLPLLRRASRAWVWPGTAAVVLACFLVSGAAGLVYQTLWVRMIDKVVGSAPFAVAAVVSAFMGGLALGSWAAGRTIDRWTERGKLLTLYGAIEVGIGLYALCFETLATACKPLYVMAYAHLWPHPWAYALFTFAGCFLLLLVPTTLMGATLPVLCRCYVTRLDALGTRAGALYSLNTIGAAAGALLCGFVLLPRLGVSGTLYAAVAANLVIGVCCLLLARGNDSTAAPIPPGVVKPQSGKAATQTDRTRDPVRIWALTVFAVSGFCAMACEVFWTRLIGLIIGPTVYAFSVVVATFIIGLAAGGMLFGWLADRLNRDLTLLHVTQLSAALLSLGVSQLLGDSQFFFAKVIQSLQHDYTRLMQCQALLLFVLLLGPTLCWGAAFPLVNRIGARGLSTLGRSIGGAYAVNTIGAILGAFGAGFILIPLVGKETGLRLTIGLQCAIAGLGRLIQSRNARRPWAGRLAAATILLSPLPIAWHFPDWPPGLLSRGWYRDFGALQDTLARTGWWAALRQGKSLLAHQRRGQEVVFQGEGVGGFTTVERETTSMGTVEWAMFNSGKADASSHGDRSTQTLSGHLPLLFHPGARNVMVLGLASGMTSGEVLLYPVERLDILEINAQVVEACRRFFAPFNRDCLNDPRTRLIVQDGRNHLALTGERYDVIISEPSNPWMAGLANLYTLEFFQLVRQRLTDLGIFAQWIQAYEMDWETFNLLGRTFAAVFGDGALFKVGPGDYLLLGFANRGGLDWDTARNNLAFAQRSGHMVLRDIASLAHLVVTEDLPHLFDPGPLHTDDRPRLEYAAPRRLYAGGLDLEIAAADRLRLTADTQALLTGHDRVEDLLNLIELGASIHLPLFARLDPSGLDEDRQARYMNIVTNYCTATLVPSFRVLGNDRAKQACAELQIQGIERHLARGHGRPADHYNLGLSLAAAGRIDDAVNAFNTAIRLDTNHREAHTALGLIAAQGGRFADALPHLRKAAALAPNRADAHKNLGMAEARACNPAAAAQHLSAALRLAPDDVVALNELGLVRLQQGQTAEAHASFSAALNIDAGNAEAHHNLGMLFLLQRKPEQSIPHFQTALRLRPDNAAARRNLQAALALSEQDQPANTRTVEN